MIALGIERAHYIGFSWRARLRFAIGEHPPVRVRSLVLCGNERRPRERSIRTPRRSEGGPLSHLC